MPVHLELSYSYYLIDLNENLQPLPFVDNIALETRRQYVIEMSRTMSEDWPSKLVKIRNNWQACK